MYVCVCNAITETQVLESVASGVSTLEDLQMETGVGNCCGCCTETARAYLPSNCAEACPSLRVAMSQTVAARVTAAHAAVTTTAQSTVSLLKDCAPVRWVSRVPQAHRVAAKVA